MRLTAEQRALLRRIAGLGGRATPDQTRATYRVLSKLVADGYLTTGVHYQSAGRTFLYGLTGKRREAIGLKVQP